MLPLVAKFGKDVGNQIYTLASGFDAGDGRQLSSEEYTRAWGGFLGMVVGTFAGLGVSRGVQAGARGTAIRGG